MSKIKIFCNILIAALLISCAASFALAQKKNKSKKSVSKNTQIEDAKPSSTPEAAPSPESDEPKSEKKNARANNTDESLQETNPSTSSVKKDETNVLRFSYEFTQKEFFTSRIVIEHDANGKGEITFERKSAGEPITDPIEISTEVWARIKSLWDGLNFLDSTTDYQTDKQFPHLGTMRLKMKQGTKERTAEFNWTNDKKASELVNEYRRIAEQAMFVFDINLARDVSPLETPKLMNNFADMLRRNAVSDPKQLLPLLRDIYVDERLPLIARNHANRLVKQIEKSK